jgi:outer membrane protein OmpA-like peptidoglycan-associated protein
MGKVFKTFKESDWRFLTSSGISAGVGEVLCVGGTGGDIFLSKHLDDDETSPGVLKLRFKAAGPGVGLSLLPVDVSGSRSKWANVGTVYHGGASDGSALQISDFTGWCVICVGSATVGSTTTVYFNTLRKDNPILCRAFCVIDGVMAGLPSISAMQYWGRISATINPLKSADPKEKPTGRAIFQNIPPALTLPADALFGFARFDLKPAANAALNEAARLISKQRVRQVIIAGYTDSIGTKEYNKNLATNRANAVKNWLVQNKVPNAVSFVATGIGADQPVAPNKNADGSDNPDGRQKNRRVEVILVP